MDGDDLWSAAVTGDQDYQGKTATKKKEIPPDFSSNYNDEDYRNVNKDYSSDRPTFYSSKTNYDEGQYNYGDTHNNAKRQNYASPSHQQNKRQKVNVPESQTNRENCSAQTTEQLASKKHFGDKRSRFNLTHLKANVNQQPGNHSNKPPPVTNNKTNYQWNKAPIKSNFGGPPEHIQPSQEKKISDGHTLHPNFSKDGILLGSSHEDKVLFYNTRANSGTEQSKFKGEEDSSQAAWENYNKYHYINKEKKTEAKQAYQRDENRRGKHNVDERIKQVYNESLKEREVIDSDSRFDGIDERNRGLFGGRGTQQREGHSKEKFVDECGGKSDWYKGGNTESSNRHGERDGRYWDIDDRHGFRDREDRYDGWDEDDGGHGFRGNDRGGRHGFRDRDDDGNYGFGDGDDGGRHGFRDGEDGGRYGFRNRDDDGNYGFGDGDDGGRHGFGDRDDGGRHGFRDGGDDDGYGFEDGDHDGRHGFNDRDGDGRHGFRDGGDGYGFGDGDHDGRHGFRDGGDGGRHGFRDGGDGDGYVFRDRDDGGIHSFRDEDYDGGHGFGDGEGSDRCWERDSDIFCNREEFERASRFDDGEGRFARKEHGRYNYSPERLEETGRSDTPYYFVEGDKQAGAGVEKGRYPVKGNRNQGYPIKGNKDRRVLEQSTNQSYAVDDTKAPMKADAENKSKNTDIKQMLIDAGNKSVLSYRKTRAKTLTPGTTSSNAFNVVRPGGNPMIRYIVNPLGNHSSNLGGNMIVNNFPAPATSSSISATNKTNAMNPLINMGFIPPLQYIPPGTVPVGRPNMPFVVRYNAMPVPAMQHPLLNNVIIPPPNQPTQYFGNQHVPLNIIPNKRRVPPNITVVDDDPLLDANGNPQPLMNVNVRKNNPLPLIRFPPVNVPQPQLNLGTGLLADPFEWADIKEERKLLLQNALQQIDARKPGSKNKKFKSNPKKTWFNYDCYLLHKRRLRKLVRLKKARNQNNETEVEELRQCIREINREYIPLLRERKSKYIADLEEKGEIGLLCEMAVTSLVDRVVQIRKVERRERERERLSADSAEKNDGATKVPHQVIVIDDYEDADDDDACEDADNAQNVL